MSLRSSRNLIKSCKGFPWISLDWFCYLCQTKQNQQLTYPDKELYLLNSNHHQPPFSHIPNLALASYPSPTFFTIPTLAMVSFPSPSITLSILLCPNVPSTVPCPFSQENYHTLQHPRLCSAQLHQHNTFPPWPPAPKPWPDSSR
jgi:hypothetical protein